MYQGSLSENLENARFGFLPLKGRNRASVIGKLVPLDMLGVASIQRNHSL